MQLKYMAIVAAVVVGVIGIGYMIVPQPSGSEGGQVVMQDTTPDNGGADQVAGESVESGSDEVAQTAAGVYTQYTAAAVAASTADHIILVFSASWCPTCRALDQDIVANEEVIPAGVEIYTVDFDAATELRRQYGVTVQHTLVEVDADGNELQKWVGGTTLASVLNRLR